MGSMSTTLHKSKTVHTLLLLDKKEENAVGQIAWAIRFFVLIMLKTIDSKTIYI